MRLKSFHQWLNQLQFIDSIIGLIGVVVILLGALAMQIFYHEAPCPLCLLQRVAFVNIGLALILNLRYGNKVSHWGMLILSAFSGIAVSIRQILLHINSPVGYGDAILGLHMYTWCFIGFSIAIAGGALMLIIYPEVRAIPRKKGR